MTDFGDRPSRRRFAEAMAALGVLCAAQGASAETAPPRGEPKRGPAADAGRAPWMSLPPTPALPAARRSELVAINGTSIYFAQFGDGADVVLLHGGTANANYWGHQVAALAKDYRVTVMDTRGHGRSPVVSHAFGFAVFAEDVADLLDYLGIPAAAIVGWSDGAITGLQLGMTKPGLVTRLFAFGANSSLDGLKAGGARNKVFAAFTTRSKAEYGALSPHPERWPQLVDGLRAMWRREPNYAKPQLAKITAPTAISDGEYDEIIKPEHTRQIALDIPGARLMIQPRVSHFAMLQNPDQFNQTLIEFLAG
jgi:pimeloyl-ACP methyl ester carboxylesterase